MKNDNTTEFGAATTITCYFNLIARLIFDFMYFSVGRERDEWKLCTIALVNVFFFQKMIHFRFD